MEEKQIKKCLRCGYSSSSKGRSNNQNRYYWGCVVHTLSDETGFTRDEIHEIIKHKFLTETHIYKSKKSKIEEVLISKSTTQLDTKEFEDLMTRIRIWASSRLGVFIAEPNEIIQEEN